MMASGLLISWAMLAAISTERRELRGVDCPDALVLERASSARCAVMVLDDRPDVPLAVALDEEAVEAHGDERAVLADELLLVGPVAPGRPQALELHASSRVVLRGVSCQYVSPPSASSCV